MTKETTIQLRVKLISSKEKDRGEMNKLKYDDTEGRDISCGQDKNDFIIELVDIPKKRNQRDSHVQQIYFWFKDELWRKVQRHLNRNN